MALEDATVQEMGSKNQQDQGTVSVQNPSVFTVLSFRNAFALLPWRMMEWEDACALEDECSTLPQIPVTVKMRRHKCLTRQQELVFVSRHSY
jgi:hypothetical protein